MTPKIRKYLLKCLRITESEQLEESKEIGSYGNYPSEVQNPVHRKDTKQNLTTLLNGIKTKYVKRDIKLKEQSNYSSSNFTDRFVVTRVLGHPELDPNLSKWQETKECWI